MLRLLLLRQANGLGIEEALVCAAAQGLSYGVTTSYWNGPHDPFLPNFVLDCSFKTAANAAHMGHVVLLYDPVDMDKMLNRGDADGREV